MVRRREQMPGPSSQTEKQPSSPPCPLSPISSCSPFPPFSFFAEDVMSNPRFFNMSFVPEAGWHLKGGQGIRFCFQEGGSSSGHSDAR